MILKPLHVGLTACAAVLCLAIAAGGAIAQTPIPAPVVKQPPPSISNLKLKPQRDLGGEPSLVTILAHQKDLVSSKAQPRRHAKRRGATRMSRLEQELKREEDEKFQPLQWMGHFSGGRNLAPGLDPIPLDWVDEKALFYSLNDCHRWINDLKGVYSTYEGHKSCVVFR